MLTSGGVFTSKPPALTSHPCHHLQVFVEDPPKVFIVHSSGMAPGPARKNTDYRHSHSIVGMSEITSHSHKKLDDGIPQRPEVDIEHRDEVTQGYLRAPSGGVNVKNPSQRDTRIYFLIIALDPVHKSAEMFAFIRILAPQQWVRRTCWKVDGGPWGRLRCTRSYLSFRRWSSFSL